MVLRHPDGGIRGPRRVPSIALLLARSSYWGAQDILSSGWCSRRGGYGLCVAAGQAFPRRPGEEPKRRCRRAGMSRRNIRPGTASASTNATAAAPTGEKIAGRRRRAQGVGDLPATGRRPYRRRPVSGCVTRFLTRCARNRKRAGPGRTITSNQPLIGYRKFLPRPGDVREAHTAPDGACSTRPSWRPAPCAFCRRRTSGDVCREAHRGILPSACPPPCHGRSVDRGAAGTDNHNSFFVVYRRERQMGDACHDRACERHHRNRSR